MIFAILSDIHANSWALKAVLNDIKERNIHSILNLGDSLYGPLDPQGTFELIRANKMLSICGNEDRIIIDKTNGYSQSDTLALVRSNLDHNALKWLNTLLPTLTLPQTAFGFHGIPGNDSLYLLEYPDQGHLSVKPDRKILEQISDIEEPVILCGHSHIPRVLKIKGKLIVNPGSVGCPAFDDDIPEYHRVENNSNQACYAVLEQTHGHFSAEIIRVSYDYAQPADCARRNNHDNWARWISTGKI